MKRTFFTVVSLLAIAACSDNSKPPESAINGHWLYNPGQCELKLKTDGLFDLKIRSSQIHIGDSKIPLPGEWKNYEGDSEVKSKAKTWLANCPTATLSPKQIEQADVFVHSDRMQNVFYIALPNQWLMVDDDIVYWLLPFDDVKSMELPIEYPDDIKQDRMEPLEG